MKYLATVGVAVLLLATGTAHAECDTHGCDNTPVGVTLPDTIIGNWCFAEDSMEGEDAQILTRDCVGDAEVKINQDRIRGEGIIGGPTCTFEKTEQISPKAYLIHTRCSDDSGGPTEYELVDGRLHITSISKAEESEPKCDIPGCDETLPVPVGPPPTERFTPLHYW
jgi:hypothetical protein